ncbi:nucleoside-diphosphate kinase [Actinomadura violacea]|uniref:nucleoside-diphosphate kinase n=1 Tax=Actinomadura violacea TaxID=2819934 RepID=A0ABS3RMS9_9ACTN|nr:nucleoside-diphosphate kinase [Actinomadura violacea]MBO2457374.1 hypothetical protein [Actinomadura violacea]
METTLVIVKPDGVARGLVGTVIGRLERAGLRLVGLRLARATREQVLAHYTDDPEWLENAGSRAIAALRDDGVDWRALTGCQSASDVGRLIRMRLVDYLCEGPIVVLQVAGPSAVGRTRRIVGATLPLRAEAGSLRGGHCADVVTASFREKRALWNIVHASGDAAEARREIGIWCADTASR